MAIEKATKKPPAAVRVYRNVMAMTLQSAEIEEDVEFEIDPSHLARSIVDLLLELPWQEREHVISDVLCNGIFCCHCGLGSRDEPNPDCQCTNDE